MKSIHSQNSFRQNGVCFGIILLLVVYGSLASFAQTRLKHTTRASSLLRPISNVVEDAPTISVFTVNAPNGPAVGSLTVTQGEDLAFRWQLSGGAATQLTLDGESVLGRTAKLLRPLQTGQFTYTLTASNATGSASQAVTVNVVAPVGPPPAPLPIGETLYNGIVLPNVWPPKPTDYLNTTETPSYLTAPPAVIPLNLGRQFFVDDFLIESTTLTRQFHPATMHAGNPVLSATTAVEKSGIGPMALPFSNGVFYDPSEKLYKLWYECGYRISVCYAVSNDGLSWVRPVLDVVPGTNIVYQDARLVDNYTNWIDLAESDPARRYKMMRVISQSGLEFNLHYSSDGIHWSAPVVVSKDLPGDRTTFFYNPFRQRWGLSLRNFTTERVRHYVEHRDLSFALNSIVKSAPSSAETLFQNTSKWLKADSLDTPHPNAGSFKPELYNLDVAPYESLLLGQFNILRGGAHLPVGRPKLNHVYFGFSRDGFNWHRPNRQPMFAPSETSGAWNYGNVQSSAGGPLIVGDQLYFYFSGRAGTSAGGNVDAGGATGLATMRRDGFASMSGDSSEGTLTTRAVTFDGRYLFVNADIAPNLTGDGSLCAEVLDANGQPIAPFTRGNCVSFSGNSTKQMLGWSGGGDLSALIGQTVKLRFYVRNGKLYSFWISPSPTGISRGFVGGGGPAFSSQRDDNPTPPVSVQALLSPAVQNVIVGQTVTLHYTVSNASAAQITPAIPGCTIDQMVSNVGSCTFTATTAGAYSWRLQAENAGQSAVAYAQVTVREPLAAPVINTFTATPATVLPNQDVTLSWTLAGGAAETIRVEPNVGLVLAGNSIIVQPAQTTTYSLIASNAAGSATRTVEVIAQVPSGGANQAIQLDGTSGVVRLSTRSSVLTQQWTMSVWFKTSAQPGDFQTILGNGSGNDVRVTGGTNSKLLVSTYVGGFNNFFGTRRVNDGQWHHVVAVRNSDRLFVYLDGTVETESTTGIPYLSLTSSSAASFNVLTIGNRGTGHEWFNGCVDDARAYLRALTPNEAVALYNHGTGVGAGVPSTADNGLWFGFDFNEASGTAFDFSGNNRVATLIGGATRVPRGAVLPPDTQAPVVTIQPPAATTVTQTSLTLNGTATDDTSVVVVTYQTDRNQSGSASGTANWTANVSLVSGTNNITVQATDAAGNTGTASIAIIYSPVPFPTASLTPANATIATGQSIALTFSSANAATVSVSPALANCTLTPNTTVVCQAAPTATTTYTFTATDAQARTAQAVATITVVPVLEAPVIASFTANAMQVVQGGSATLAWTLTGGAPAALTLDQGIGSVLNQSTKTVTPAQTTTYRLTATNASGSDSRPLTLTVVSAPDVTAPQVTLLAPTQFTFPAGTTQVTLAVTTNETAACRVGSTPDEAFAAMTPFALTDAQTHSTALATQDGQSYTRYVRCGDPSGNVSAPLAVTFNVSTIAATNDRVIQLDGASGVVRLSSRSSVSTSQWTMSLWFKTSARPNDFQTMLGNQNGNDLRVTGGTNSKLLVSTYVGGFNNFFGTRRINDGLWHHVVTVRDGDRLYVYLDGTVETESNTGLPYLSLTSNAATGFNVLTIGNRGTGHEWFNGCVDDARAYLRALTASEAAGLYNHGTGVGAGVPSASDNGLWLGFDFNEPGDPTGLAYDFSGNSRIGTLIGGATRVPRGTALPPDAQAPVVTIQPPAATTTAQASITLNGTATDDTGVISVAYQTDRNQSGSASGTANWTANVTLLAGLNNVTVRAFDAVGNAGTATLAITHTPPTEAPVISSFTANALQIVQGESATLSWTLAGGATAALTLDQGIGSVLNQTSRTVAPAQTTTYRLTASNVAGSDSRTLTITVLPPPDTTPPQLTRTAPLQNTFPTGTTQVTLGVSTNESAACRVALGANDEFAAMTPFALANALTHSHTITTLDGQNYTRYVRCADGAGNVSAPLTIMFTVNAPGTVVNRALQLDGSTGYVALPTRGDVFTPNWTLSAWVKTSAFVGDFHTILGNQSGNELRLYGGAQGRVLVSLYLNGFVHFFGTRRVNDGAWHQVAAVREGGRLYVYVDGTPDTDSETGLPYKTIASGTANSQFNLRALGNRGTPHEWFGGCLDDVRAYARALTANEIAAQFNNGLGAPVIAETGLLFGFTFDETSGEALDVTTHQRHGQLIGGATRVVR